MKKKNTSSLPAFSLVLLCLLFWNSIAFAQGFIIPRPDPNFSPEFLSLIEHAVNVDIIDQVATVSVDQVFFNHSNRPIEGTYYFPLPKDASISDFKMYADGKVLKGELLEKDKARQIYEEIVRRKIDPALLEYLDSNLFAARIFPIPSKKDRKIVLKYSSLLSQEAGMVKFSYPLRGEIGSNYAGSRPLPPNPRNPWLQPLGKNEQRKKVSMAEPTEVSQIINFNIQSKISIKNIYSPSHDVDISRSDNHHAKISYEGKRKKVEDNFVLYYSFSQKDFGVNLLSYKPEQTEDGFFMLLVSPKTEFEKSEIIDKDIIFILDTSGSMEGEKIKQARHALKYCLNHLNKNDRFNVITFSSETAFFRADKLVNAAEYCRDANRFVDDISAKGGTNINDALLEALKLSQNSDRPVSIVFITDGLPTVGEREVGQIIKNLRTSNKNGIKIFSFGVGYDVNTFLLDKISAESQAVSDYIEPEESIDEKISSFYDKVRFPVLTDLEINYGPVKVEDVFPKKIPNLYKGVQITILGRFKNEVDSKIVLSGKLASAAKKFNYGANFKHTEGNNFLPQLWATRKIGFLMDEIRLHGENKELHDQIVQLSKKHGVMSPYTSFLVQEEEKMASRDRDQLLRPATEWGEKNNIQELSISTHAPRAMKGAAGSYDVKMSKKTRSMKEAESISRDSNTKMIGNRNFHFDGNFWIDNEFNQEKNTVDIKYSSEAYKNLILTFSETGKFLSLGEKVIFNFKGKYIKISDAGKEFLSKQELQKIFSQ